MTNEQIYDLVAQMIRVGFVNARQPETMRVKVTLKDTTSAELVTDWLPTLCPRACMDMQYDLPDIGDQVLCLFLPYGLEQGFVIGAMYGKRQPPVQSGDKWHRLFSDGTYLEYDRAEHRLTADVKGDVDLTAAGSVTGKIARDLSASVDGSMTAASKGPAGISSQSRLSIDAPAMNMGGGGGGATSAAMQGTFRLTRGDIIAEAVSLRGHVHTCPACGALTSPPVGGGSASANGESGSGGDADSSGSGGSHEPENGNSGDISENGTASSGSQAGENNGNPATGNCGIELSPDLAAALEATGFAITPESKEQYEETKKKVHLQDNEIFDVILCLPEIAKAEAERENGQENRLGWLYLQRMFEKWLSGGKNTDPLTNNEPFWVNMDWALSYYRVKSAWKTITANHYLFSDTAKKELFNSLKKAGLVSGRREEFKFCDLEWPYWREYYFQSLRVPGMAAFPQDGLMAAMGDFNLRALADGLIEPCADGCRITVQKAAIFIWDSFNFAGEQALEYWSCANKKFQGLDPDEAVYLRNADFRAFQEEINSGTDFLVLSRPKFIDTFMGYNYEISQ